MADRVLGSSKIEGYFIPDQPTDGPANECENGFLLVEERSDGQWYDAEHGVVIRAFEIAPIENLVERLNSAVAAMEKAGETVPSHEILMKKVIRFDEPTEIPVLIEDDLFRGFAPKPGECQRVGLPVKRLRH